jgi:hypothetical protein
MADPGGILGHGRRAQPCRKATRDLSAEADTDRYLVSADFFPGRRDSPTGAKNDILIQNGDVVCVRKSHVQPEFASERGCVQLARTVLLR